MKMPYRRSIWKHDAHYKPLPTPADGADINLMARLQSIEAAKKHTPVIPIAQLFTLATELKSPPRLRGLDGAKFAAYLHRLCVYGCGVKTAVCMLAVVSKGTFPPMDKKLAAGLLKKRWITAHQAKALNGIDVKKFSMVYVERVIPRWIEARSCGDRPAEIDERWAGWAT
ncbi:MAG: hypothetical protein ACRET0_00365 [Steroidobacteraceae bacterium]